MKISEITFFALLGLQLQGDVGPYTCYRSARHKLVMFAKAPPHKPPSQLQAWHRARWSMAARAWKALRPAHRDRWRLAAKRERLVVGGYNLFIWHVTTHQVDAIRTIERHTGLDLLPLSRRYEA